MLTRLLPCIVSNRRILTAALARRPFSAISPPSEDSGLFLHSLQKKELSPSDIVNKPAAAPLPVVRALPAAPTSSTAPSDASEAKPAKPQAPVASRSFKTLLDSLTLDKANDISVWHQLRWTATDPVGRRRFLKAQGLKRVAFVMKHVEGLYSLTAALSAFNVWACGRSPETRAAMLSSGWPQAAAVAMARQGLRGIEGETVAKFWRSAEFLDEGLRALLKPRDATGLGAGGRHSTAVAADGGTSAPGVERGKKLLAYASGSNASAMALDADSAVAGSTPAPARPDADREREQDQELAEAAFASELAAQLAVPAVLKPLLQALAEAEASLRRHNVQLELLRQQRFRAQAEQAGRESGAGAGPATAQRDDGDLLSVAAGGDDAAASTVPAAPSIAPLVRLLESVAEVLIAGSKGSATANKEARVAAAKARQAAARAKAPTPSASVTTGPPQDAIASAASAASAASTSSSPPAAAPPAPSAAPASRPLPKAEAEASAFASSAEAAADLFEPVVRQLRVCGVLATAVRSIAAADLLSPGSDRPPQISDSKGTSEGRPKAAVSSSPKGSGPSRDGAGAAAAGAGDAAPSSAADRDHALHHPNRAHPLLFAPPSIYLRVTTNLAATSRAAADALFVAGAGEVAAGHLARLRPQRLSKRQSARYAQLAGLLRSVDMARQRLSSSLTSPTASDVVMRERYRSVAQASASVVVPLAGMLSLWRRGDDRDYVLKGLALLCHLSRWRNSPAADAVGAAAAATCCPDGTLVFSRSSPLAADPMLRSMLAELEQAGASHRRQTITGVSTAAAGARKAP